MKFSSRLILPPESLKGGAKLLKQVSASSKPVLLAVTEDLSPMLKKLQFEEIGVHQAPFKGEMVDKHLMVNRAFLDYVKNNENNTENILLNLQESIDSDDFIEMSKELKPILKNAVKLSHRVKNSPKPTIGETKYSQERPEQTKYKLEDLIGVVPYPGGNLRQYLESVSKRNGGILNYLSYLNI